MRKIRDVLRLKLDAGLSHQQIAAALGVSKGVVTKYVGLAAAAGLDWASVQAIDEAALERRLALLLEDGQLPDLEQLRHELVPRAAHYQDVTVTLPDLAAYDHLLEAA